jgi:hypothetical protein
MNTKSILFNINLKYLLLISSLLIFASCGKKTQIKITAKNAATGEGYAGLGFRLREVKPYVTSTGEIQKAVYEGTLNNQGEAVFEYRLKNRSYVITTITPENDNRCYINNTSYTLHRDDDNLKFDFRFAPCAYLKLKIENVNCSGSDDKIFFNRTWLTTNTSGNGVTQEGCFSYQGDFFELPEGEYLYEWEVTRSGLTQIYDSTFTINEGEYYTFELNY